MESLNLNELSDVSEAIEGPSSPILSNSKISRRVMVNRKLKKERSRTTLLNQFQQENIDAKGNNVPENQLKTAEQLEKERKMYYDMVCQTIPNFKIYNFKDTDQFLKKPTIPLQQNEKPLFCNEKRMHSDNTSESATIQTAAGKKIEISESIINEHKHMFDDIFNEEELASPLVLKCPINTSMKKISKIPVFHRNAKPKGNNTLPKIEEQPMQFDKTVLLPQTIKEIVSGENGSLVGTTNEAQTPKAEGFLQTANSSLNEQNRKENLKVAYTESLSSVNTMNKLYSNQQFEECSSSTNSLENLLYNESLGVFDESEFSTGLSHMYSTAIENPENLENRKMGIIHSNCTDLSPMNNDNLNGVADVTGINVIETNPFVEIKFTNVDHKNSQQTNKTVDYSRHTNIEHNGELNLEKTSINHHIIKENICHTIAESDNAENKVNAISGNVQCNIHSLEAYNLLLNYKQLPAENRETGFEEQQTSICSSKSVININIPSNTFNCKEKIHSKNLIELHRNRNFTGFSEDSTSNMDYKLSEHSTKVKKRMVKAQKKMISADFVGFDKNTQKLANDQAIVYVNNIKEMEKEIHNTEFIIQSKSKEEKKLRDRKNKKHKLDHGDEKDKDNQSLPKDLKIKSDKKRKEREHPKQNKLKVVKEVCENAIKEVTINEKMNRTVTYDHLSVTSEQSSKKYKEHKKRKSAVTDKEVVQENKNQIIELNPNQKKFKIEIDCNNKFHINICCNAVQNICEKETIKYENECKNDVEPIRPAEAKLNSKIVEDTTAKAMFKSASGKDIILNKKLLNDAEKKFEQIDTDLNTCEKGIDDLQTKEINPDTNNYEAVNSRGNEKDKLLNKFINKASKFYHDITKLDYQQQDKKLEKNKEISNNVPSTQKASQVSQNALPNNLCGFKSASGKRVKISEKALKTARKMYHDIDNTLNKDKDTECNKDNLSFKANNDAIDKVQKEKEKRKTRVLYTDMENMNSNTRPNVPVVSGKLVKDVEKRKTLASKEQQVNNGKLPLDILTNNMLCGFQSASGKSMKLSADALEKAKRIFDESYSPAGDSSNQPTLLSDFQSACDTKVNELKKQFLAKQAYENSDATTLCMGDFEKHDSGKIVDVTDDTILSVNNTASRKAFEYLEDVAETVDCALEKIKKDRLQRASRRRLGISRCKQINISREKIDQAKKLFSNESFADSLRDASVVITPKRSQVASSSTPLRSTAEFKSVDFFKNIAESEITPIKAAAFKKEPGISNIDNSSIIIQNRTPGTLDDWYGTVVKQINMLRDTLKTLEVRKCDLEKQMSFIHYGSKEHRKQNSGVLFNKKSFNNKTIPLKVLDINGGGNNNNVEDTILKVTPKNANMVHFNFAGLVNSNATQDGAIIIPNAENLVGLSEIEMAFQTMVGVDPVLIPKGWIANHYCLIVWKLASYERRAPRQMHGVLSIENVIQQLKYRYDREIDKAQRPAIRKILEKDDAPQKRMILCVSDIVEVPNGVELELTDGWYCIRTIIDEPLTREVNKNKIKIGTKLIVYGAQLLNCDGCHPLEVTNLVKLKINYNCTRRAIWYAKLGYQRCPEPFTVPLSSIHMCGGIIGCLKLHVLRVYPMRFMEQVNNMKVWRNKKAEEKYANTFENDRLEKIEKIHYSIQEKYDREMRLQNKYIERSKLNQSDIVNITCPKTLYKLLENSNDPDSWLEILLPSQRVSILEYRQQICLQREQEISNRISEEINKLKLNQRKVTPVLKLLVLENSCDSENIQQFSIWYPKEDDITLLKEGCSFIAYNVLPGSHGSLFSHSKTYFKADDKAAPHIKFKRQLFPIAMTLDPYCKPLLNEFDTIGLVAQFRINNHYQTLWLTETTGIMLCVTIKDGPAVCSLLDGITKGQVVSLVNLVHCKPEKDFGQAIANQFTIISSSPQSNYLRDGIELFKMKLPKDTAQLIRNCEQKIEKYTENNNFKQNFAVTSFTRSNFSDTLSDFLDISDDGMTSSRLTPTDVAMSLIDTDKFT